MKCEIIRDLLPSYLEGLTSDESNKVVEMHLKDCKECSKIHEEMKLDINVDAEAFDTENIKLFKKINRRVAKAVSLTLVVCAVIVGIYLFFFGFGWKVNSDDMIIEYEYEDGRIGFSFELTDGKVLNAWTDYDFDRKAYIIKFTECYLGKLDDRGEHPERFSYGVSFGKYEEDIDKNSDSFINHESENEFSNSDEAAIDNRDAIIILEFKNEIKTYRVVDILKEYGVIE